MTYDLHTHSYFSDGDLSPEALVEAAVDHGITHLALTDHDSIAGLARAQRAAQEYDLSFVSGVEFSCDWNGQLLHVLGLSIDPDNDALNEGARCNQRLRWQRAEAMHADFQRHDIDLTERVSELVGEHAVPTRPHFAQALIDQGVVSNKNQAFRRFLVRGKVGYVPIEWPPLATVVEWIQAAGGVAVLAHPARYRFTRTKLIRLIEDMKQCGAHTLEVTTPVTTPQESRSLADLCRRFDLYASTGSDFHSFHQPWARLGAAQPLEPNLTPVWSLF